MKTVIYINQESYDILSILYPETHTRKYIVREFSEFVTSQYDWNSDYRIDFEVPRGHNPLLYIIWNEKPFFMLDALEKNFYGSDYYMWVDIGCFRDETLLPTFSGFPLVSKMNPEKLQFIQINPFTEEDKQNPLSIDFRFFHSNRIGGTMFTCPKEKIHVFSTLHRALLSEFSEKGIFKGKDQSLFAFHVLQHPELFELIQRPQNSTSKNDPWFYLQDYLSGEKVQENPLSFVIVGPGMMSIPPKGWGAVEILIWDYAKGLEALGHKVTIINTKDMNAAIVEVKRIQPDVVHIQYDDYAHIAAQIRNDTKIVGITTHYGYLEQPGRWGDYGRVFHTMLRQTASNVYHFVLSSQIGDIYRQFGVPSDKIILTPNGANEKLFRFTEKPKHPDRSIYLAKLDYRKRQYLFQNIPDLYFAGNPADNRFNTASPQYLGEWSKGTLYENLTEYGNLVLLSDGEADPLVVKEALICGLGVVLSQWSTANLDVSKPYITVIPENKIGDLPFVESEIRKNREVSKQYRKGIREYGLTFEWTKLIKEYSDTCRQLIDI